jgi:hypothetical protein
MSEFPYPTTEQGLHSVRYVIQHSIGAEKLSNEELINHCWVGLGSGLAMGFPVDEGFGNIQISDEHRQILEEHTNSIQEGRSSHIDGKKLLKTLLAILQQLLVAVIIILGLCSTVQAQQFEIRPAFDIQYAKLEKQIEKQEEICKDGCCKEELSFNEAKTLAKKSKKPLLTWVGGNFCPRCVDDTKNEFVHTFLDKLDDQPDRSVAVWLPGSDGWLYRIGIMTKWVEGSREWGHAASVRKMIRAYNENRVTTLEGWAAPDKNKFGPPPDSPMWGKAIVMNHDNSFSDNNNFRDPSFIINPVPVPVPTTAPMMFSAPMIMSDSCSAGSCGAMGNRTMMRRGGG